MGSEAPTACRIRKWELDSRNPTTIMLEGQTEAEDAILFNESMSDGAVISIIPGQNGLLLNSRVVRTEIWWRGGWGMFVASFRECWTSLFVQPMPYRVFTTGHHRGRGKSNKAFSPEVSLDVP